MQVEMKDSFIVRLGVELGLTALALKLGAPWLAKGIVGDIVGHFARHFIGEAMDRGILVVDLGVDAIKVGLQRKEYRDAIVKAYNKAKARVYTEEEKRAIRKEFQDIIRKYGPVDGVRPRKDSERQRL